MIDGNGPGVVTLGGDDRAAALALLKAVLRVASGDEDDLIVAFAETALGLAEQFTGRIGIARVMTETMPVSAAWQRLGAAPVRAIAGVASLDTDGTATALAVDAFAIDIDPEGGGWVRIAVPVPMQNGVRKITVTFEAGMADGWDSLPAPIRQGAALLAAHLFTERDTEKPPPAAVTALWRPFRAVALGSLQPGAARC